MKKKNQSKVVINKQNKNDRQPKQILLKKFLTTILITIDSIKDVSSNKYLRIEFEVL